MKNFSRASLPARERGLKQRGGGRADEKAGVDPRAGAWIETRSCPRPLRWGLSLPARERGLKLIHSNNRGEWNASLPARERGLKHRILLRLFRQRDGRSPRGSVD